jgi:GTP-binding protein HflX
VLTDTVGFIKKLPHQLVAAFKATLEELAEADVLVHVVDASHPGLDDQVAAVEALLAELELSHRPTIVVLNKADRLEADAALRNLIDRWNAVAISALTGEGIDELLMRIDEALRPRVERVTLFIPYRDAGALALCYERGRVHERRDEAEGIHLDVELPRRLVSQFAAFRVRP